MNTLLVLLAAILVDRIIGDPHWLWRHIPHPVVLFGNAIGWADTRFNRVEFDDDRREKIGFLVIAVLLILAALVGHALTALFGTIGLLGTVLHVVVVAVFLAQKSLCDHVEAVVSGLRMDGIAGGRKAVSMIVGRDVNALDEAGISRAAIESLAENSSDGVVAPAFWFAVFGLPGLLAYKMLNTADSMIGHMNERHRAFGRASAKFDDFANWVPARATGILICAAGGVTAFKAHFEIMRRDAPLHRSPNAGWPEAAMAAALDMALGGPRRYGELEVDAPYLHADGRLDVGVTDIEQSLRIYDRAMWFGTALLVIIALIVV